MGSQRVRRDLATEQQQQQILITISNTQLIKLLYICFGKEFGKVIYWR